MNESRPLYTWTKIAAIIDGKPHTIGYQFSHPSRFITALVSFPLAIQFEWNRFFHNRRFPTKG